MPSFWLRVVVHGATWTALALQLPGDLVPWVLLLAAAYLAGFFVAELGVRLLVPRPLRWTAPVVSVLAALAALALASTHLSTAFVVLAAWLLVAPPLVAAPGRSEHEGLGVAALGAALVALVAVAVLASRHGAQAFDQVALALVGVVTVVGAGAFRQVDAERRESRERYGALLSEYRDLKRAGARAAESARTEERISVARRLHDSVGHRLTSLLMQLEADRLRAEQLGEPGEEQRRRAEELKQLAQRSLDETRAAVTALGEDSLAGMPALLRLIRNLEVESGMQVEFTLGSGAMGVHLDPAPAIALYRAVQEALTNAMRHGSTRRAKVKVEVPAGRIVRFEVENEVVAGASQSRPGFGLTTMRERVEAAGGQLEVMAGATTFLVRGSFPVSA